MPIWSQYKRRDLRFVPSIGPFPAGLSFLSQDSSQEINQTIKLKNWSCFQTLLGAYLHFRFLFTGIYYVSDLWFSIQILPDRWQGRMHRSHKMNRINAQLPICLRADTHLWLQNKRVFAADSSSAGQDFMVFSALFRSLSLFQCVWSVKLQYILSSLFHSQIVLSLSYLSPLPRYISSFYLQHFGMEGGSFLGSSSCFFVSVWLWLFRGAHRSAGNHSNIWGFLCIEIYHNINDKWPLHYLRIASLQASCLQDG